MLLTFTGTHTLVLMNMARRDYAPLEMAGGSDKKGLVRYKAHLQMLTE